MNLRFDTGSLRLGGWAALSQAERAGDRLLLSLKAGPVLLGRLRRDQARPDVDQHLGFAVPTPGFGISDYGLVGFAQATGLQDLAIVVETETGEGRERFSIPFPEGVPAVAPLGTRHGIGKLMRLADIWIDGSRNLRMRFEGSPKVPKALDAYQVNRAGDLVRVAADRTIAALTSVIDVTLINPFTPVLLVFKGEDEAIDALDILPFPSLARGGLHSAERLIAAHGGDDLADTATVGGELFEALLRGSQGSRPRVATIDIDPATATGLEPALNEDLLDWITGFLGVEVVQGGTDASRSRSGLVAEVLSKHAVPQPRTGHSLELPADSIPTIAALVSELPSNAAAQRLTGGLAVVDPSRQGKIWSIWQPPFGKALEGLQLKGSQRASPLLSVRAQGDVGPEQEIVLDFPLALAFRDWPSQVSVGSPLETAAEVDAPLLRSGAEPGRAPISVLILSDAAGTSPLPLIESLARQEQVAIGQVVLARPHGSSDAQVTQTLRRRFKDGTTIVNVPVTAGRLEQIAAAQGHLANETVFVADAATVLADHRCLATLAPMLEVPDVASVGCLLRAANDKMASLGAGYSLSQINLRTSPAIAFEMIDASVWRGPTTYPVVANSLCAVMTRTRLLRDMVAHGSSVARPEVDDLLLGLQLIEAGGINICTTVVSAFSGAQARPSQMALTIPYRISPERIARIAESSTLVQRIA